MNETITAIALAAGGGNNNIQVVFKYYAPFTNYMSKINNTQTGHTKDINILMSMYNLRTFSNNY